MQPCFLGHRAGGGGGGGGGAGAGGAVAGQGPGGAGGLGMPVAGAGEPMFLPYAHKQRIMHTQMTRTGRGNISLSSTHSTELADIAAILLRSSWCVCLRV